jgi:hypothetical protein
VWEPRRAEANDRTAEQQRRVRAIQHKLDKLDEAFLYSEVIDVTTYGRQLSRSAATRTGSDVTKLSSTFCSVPCG